MQDAKVLKYFKDKNNKKYYLSNINWLVHLYGFIIFSTEKQFTQNALYVAGKAQIKGVFQLMT